MVGFDVPERLFLYTVVNIEEKRWSRFIVDRCNLLDFVPHMTCVVLLQLYCFQYWFQLFSGHNSQA